MNKRLLSSYKKKLLAERDKLVEQLQDDKDQIKDYSKVEVGDIVDRAYSSYEKNKTIQMSEEQKKMVQAIDFALERLEKGSYGICLQCGEAINPKRLDAIPWVTKCMRETCKPKRTA